MMFSSPHWQSYRFTKPAERATQTEYGTPSTAKAIRDRVYLEPAFHYPLLLATLGWSFQRLQA